MQGRWRAQLGPDWEAGAGILLCSPVPAFNQKGCVYLFCILGEHLRFCGSKSFCALQKSRNSRGQAEQSHQLHECVQGFWPVQPWGLRRGPDGWSQGAVCGPAFSSGGVGSREGADGFKPQDATRPCSKHLTSFTCSSNPPRQELPPLPCFRWGKLRPRDTK